MTRTPAFLQIVLVAGALTCAAAAASADHPGAAVAADSCLFGRIDNLLNDGPELAEPATHLVPLLMTYAQSGRIEFDECVVNRYFAHTAFTCLGADSMRLQLTIRLRGYGSQATSDVFYLGTQGQMRWGMRMNSLGLLFGAGPSWNAGDTATVILDLGSLPPSDSAPSYGPRYPAGVTDVLQWIRYHGHLDIVFADDTCVDYIALMPGPGGATATRSVTWGRIKQRYR